jgi:hypothetical protein
MFFDKEKRIQKKLEKLQAKKEKLTKEAFKLNNRKTCDICGKQFMRCLEANAGFIIGGAVFSEQGFEPVEVNGKLVNCVCARCIIARIKETKEVK